MPFYLGVPMKLSILQSIQKRYQGEIDMKLVGEADSIKLKVILTNTIIGKIVYFVTKYFGSGIDEFCIDGNRTGAKATVFYISRANLESLLINNPKNQERLPDKKWAQNLIADWKKEEKTKQIKEKKYPILNHLVKSGLGKKVATFKFSQNIKESKEWVVPANKLITSFEVGSICKEGTPCVHSCKITFTDGRKRKIEMQNPEIHCMIRALVKKKTHILKGLTHHFTPATEKLKPEDILAKIA